MRCCAAFPKQRVDEACYIVGVNLNFLTPNIPQPPQQNHRDDTTAEHGARNNDNKRRQALLDKVDRIHAVPPGDQRRRRHAQHGDFHLCLEQHDLVAATSKDRPDRVRRTVDVGHERGGLADHGVVRAKVGLEEVLGLVVVIRGAARPAHRIRQVQVRHVAVLAQQRLERAARQPRALLDIRQPARDVEQRAQARVRRCRRLLIAGHLRVEMLQRGAHVGARGEVRGLETGGDGGERGLERAQLKRRARLVVGAAAAAAAAPQLVLQVVRKDARNGRVGQPVDVQQQQPLRLDQQPQVKHVHEDRRGPHQDVREPLRRQVNGLQVARGEAVRARHVGLAERRRRGAAVGVALRALQLHVPVERRQGDAHGPLEDAASSGVLRVAVGSRRAGVVAAAGLDRTASSGLP